ncbi:hypothetical protein DE146DRAFT_739987 [Phaeosphaeria sp. MPI-PUGE-AT-0046c]|nr:hypothetical protein DE146DRAFT_739987 [Phaeosphaeria sp. MPI-PUGE-AT-0046c]
MRFLPTSITLFTLSSQSLFVIASESPFAISVFSTTVYASRYNASDTIEILKYPTTKAFQDYYKSAVLNFGGHVDDQHNMHREEVIINSTLKPAIKAWEAQLGVEQLPFVHAFFISSVFDWRFRRLAANLVFPPYTPKLATKEGPAEQAAYAAYGFIECRNLGRRIEECNEDGPENLILTLEYEKEYLYIWIQVVDFELGICPLHRKSFIRELGESYRETLGPEAYDQIFRTVLNKVLGGMDARFYKREDVRAIIVAGEASVSASLNLAKLAQSVVGTDTAKIMTDIPFSEVAARGAAAWARETEVTPHRFLIEEGNFPSPHEHDEL